MPFLFFYYPHIGNSTFVKRVETSRYFEWYEFEVFVLNIKSSKIRIPWTILETGVLFAGIILTYYAVCRILKFPKTIWSLKRIIFVLLAVKIELNFREFVEKIAFMGLSFICLSVTTDLVSSFVGFLREEDLIIYETLGRQLPRQI